MKHVKTCIIAVSSVVCILLQTSLNSCSTQSRHYLTQIEHLLEQDPEAASLQLDSIDTSSLNQRNLALYAILKTQADYKLYRDIPTDSVIRIATDYYGFGRKDYHAAMAWYSLGCISQLSNDENTALSAYLKSLYLFPDTTIRSFSLCEQNIARLYEKRHMNDDAVSLFSRCLANSIRLNDNNMEIFSRYHLGLCYMYTQDYEKADSIFSILLSDNRVSSIQRNNILFQMLKIDLFFRKDYIKALTEVNQYLELPVSSDINVSGFSIKGDIWYALQKQDSAYLYYKKALQSTNDIYSIANTSGKLLQLSINRDDVDDVLHYLDLYSMSMDSIFELKHISELSKIRQEHDIELIQQAMQLKMRNRSLIYLSLLIIALLISTLVFYVLRNIEQEKMRRSSIDILENKVRELSGNDGKAREVLLKLYKQRFDYCKKVFLSTPEFKTLLALKTNMLTGETTTPNMTRISTELKSSFIEVIQDIQNEMGQAKEADFITIILTCLSFDNDVIAAVVGSVTRDAIRKRKHRIKETMTSDYLRTIGWDI